MDSCCTPQAKSYSGDRSGFFVLYRPLIVIVGILLLTTIVLAQRDFANAGSIELDATMSNFMAGFFLVFSGLKLMDIAGFAKSYGMYDLLAQKVPVYGYIYPFLELGLGLAYLTRFAPQQTNTVTLIIMAFSALGVAVSVHQKKKFQCACLGTLLKVPLTNIALLEDVLMAAMAGFMLFHV